MALSTVTLKWDLTDLIQAGLSATLSITPTAQMSDTADHVLIPPVARPYTFTGGTGQLAGIVANDSPNVLPANPYAGYLISVTSAAGQVIVPQFQTQLLTGGGDVQWLDELVIVPVVATAYQYFPVTGMAATGYTGAGSIAPKVATLEDAPTITVNAAAGNLFRVTLGGNRALGNPAGGTDGQLIRVEVTQDGTGSRLLSYGSAYNLGSAGAPVLSTTPGAMDVLGFCYDAGLATPWRLLAFDPD